MARALRVRPVLKMSCVRSSEGALTFVLPVPCSANRWWRKWKNRMVLSDEARAYKALVRMAYRRQELRGEISVSLVWHRERRSGDLDKRIPIILDSLQGVAYANDSQITHLVASRCEDPKNPRVIVTVANALQPAAAVSQERSHV